MARRLAAIVFTDLAGYTELAQRDEPGALKLLHAQDRIVRPILDSHHGRRVKSMGDGLLIEFPNAKDAVEGAVELQRRIHEHNLAGGSEPLRLRLGIHLGDVERRGSDILGDAVNIASRIEPLADEGGVWFSEQVFDQVRDKVAFQCEKVGPQKLKGLREEVTLYRVVLPWLSRETPSAELPPSRLAVLPLSNISPDPNDGYLADGLTEELISVLSQVRGLRLISRTSVGQYKGTTKPIVQIASELGAGSVLEGSVRKSGDNLRISLQLIDARTDEHRWAQTYDRRLENIFAIQAEVAERTAGALQVELLKTERAALQVQPTSSLAAYESYLRGLQAIQGYGHTVGEESDRQATRYFEEAIREDPSFSAAYSQLANHLIAISGAWRPAREELLRARGLVARALELNPNSSEAHTARGNLAMQSDRDWSAAEAEFRRAIELNPSNSMAHVWYALLLMVLQRFDEAERENEVAIALDPLMLLPKIQRVSGHFHSGDPAGAIRIAEKMKVPPEIAASFRNTLAVFYALAGQKEQALEIVRPLAGSTELLPRAQRAFILARFGDLNELRSLTDDWERGKVTRYVAPVALAEGYAALGDRAKALELLETDFREGDAALWATYQSIEYDSIRDDPRFQAILRKLNLPTTLSRPLAQRRTATT